MFENYNLFFTPIEALARPYDLKVQSRVLML